MVVGRLEVNVFATPTTLALGRTLGGMGAGWTTLAQLSRARMTRAPGARQRLTAPFTAVTLKRQGFGADVPALTNFRLVAQHEGSRDRIPAQGL